MCAVAALGVTWGLPTRLPGTSCCWCCGVGGEAVGDSWDLNQSPYILSSVGLSSQARTHNCHLCAESPFLSLGSAWQTQGDTIARAGRAWPLTTQTHPPGSGLGAGPPEELPRASGDKAKPRGAQTATACSLGAQSCSPVRAGSCPDSHVVPALRKTKKTNCC